VSKTENRGAAAAFCRDNDGTYLGASAVVFVGITDPATLEALACREALALAEDLALERLFVFQTARQLSWRLVKELWVAMARSLLR